ncbi:MAG: tRNA (adenosine(37)-N6)-dimethylallyltransferase MiaA, partial [Rhizobiaceae bacterium]|nr:tRNA (adenosine(37)-N6)-dimethylallyltransferase MiaA [Rhizobiaceae bacterium]
AVVDADSARHFVLEPPRQLLVRRIDERFDRMVEQGAMDEARIMARIAPDPQLPAAKAIGVRELQSAIAGALPVAEAVERAKAATRQYSKRQATWFRHQCGAEWRRLQGSNLTALLDEMAG